MQVTQLICMECVHFREFNGGCDAFPNGIPQSIIESNTHDTPVEGQKNNIVFEKIEEDANLSM